MNNTYKTTDLTPEEVKEFYQLREKLFGNSKFKIFTEEEQNSSEMKRYEFLIEKKMRYYRANNLIQED